MAVAYVSGNDISVPVDRVPDRRAIARSTFEVGNRGIHVRNMSCK